MIFSKYASFISPVWQGAIWKILACFFFAANNGVVKLLSQPYDNAPALSSYQIAFLQNFVGFIIMLPFILPQGVKKLKIIYPSLHFYRVFISVVGVILWYMALSHMQMAEAVALSFTGPIFTVILSKFYLGERISFFRYLGITLGILGAFIITRPDRALWGSESTLSWFVVLPLSSAIAISMAKIFGRELGAKGESAENLTFYLLLFMAPLSFIPAISAWITPTIEQWKWVFLLGLLSAAAHYTTSHAYNLAEVTFLAPLGFARLIFTAVIGFMAFAEIPTSASLWIGTGVIIIGTFCLTLEEKNSYLKNFFSVLKN